jgi:hypothetical protein
MPGAARRTDEVAADRVVSDVGGQVVIRCLTVGGQRYQDLGAQL